MKIILFLLVLGVASQALAQGFCFEEEPRTVTTDWRSPLSTNTWDWTARSSDYEYNDMFIGGQSVTRTAPFYFDG